MTPLPITGVMSLKLFPQRVVSCFGAILNTKTTGKEERSLSVFYCLRSRYSSSDFRRGVGEEGTQCYLPSVYSKLWRGIISQRKAKEAGMNFVNAGENYDIFSMCRLLRLSHINWTWTKLWNMTGRALFNFPAVSNCIGKYLDESGMM